MNGGLPSPSVQHVVNERQCVLLFETIRVAYHFRVGVFIVHLICQLGVVVARRG